LSETIAVAMSGGVDSSTAAAVLGERGHRVIGVGLRLFSEPGWSCSRKSCCGSAEMEDARRVAEAIDIPFYLLDFREAFATHVIDYFVYSYLRGETPNPCVPCNEVVKFDLLLDAARRLGAGRLATGHYARLETDEASGRWVLRKGADGGKDQSYFLYSLKQEMLARALFPLGGLDKSETRLIARAAGLPVHDKAESQDICFVGERGYAEFIEAHTASVPGPGPIYDDSGEEIGVHRGIHNYTVGQRHGLGLSTSEAVYVVDIDPEGNSITVAAAEGFRRQRRLALGRVNYVSIARPDAPLEVRVRTRYRKPEVDALLTPLEGDSAELEFAEPQEPTAPGQSVVAYRGDVVLCGGTALREPLARPT